MVTDSWPTCHGFEPCAAECMPVEGLSQKVEVKILPLAWCGSSEGGVQLRCRLRHLIVIRNHEVCRQWRYSTTLTLDRLKLSIYLYFAQKQSK
ncbi:hypothetical protein TNCV_4281751 [Trichonephila clavipes]|nr:hypothetical protein TNCV_4281751 [Trichonephila clavipes]